MRIEKAGALGLRLFSWWSVSVYLARFEVELPKASNSAALIEAMKGAYPKAGLGIALDIGAKVNKGEMKW